MRSILIVYRKELTDYFSSKKFLILLSLVYIAGLSSVYVSLQNIRGVAAGMDTNVFLNLFTISGDILPSFITFISLFIPIIGIIFGFDAINSEKRSGNLSRLLSQPIFRDSVINGKFLAGITTLSIIITSIVLLIAGIGLRTIGVPPSAEEILRIMFFIMICIIYGTFWMGLSMLFSVIMEKTATSILSSIAIWLFLVVFLPIIANAVANTIAPLENATASEQLRNYVIEQNILRISPAILFSEAITTVLVPTTGHIFLNPQALVATDLNRMLISPLTLGQSLVQVWPQLVAIIALAIICFALSYIIFMRQEIRAT